MEAKLSNSRIALLLAAAGLLQAGCMTYATHTVPASRLPDCLRAESRSCQTPINFAALRQSPPTAHSVGPGDLLSVYVAGVIPAQADGVPTIFPDRTQTNIYYPPGGLTNTPALGLPMGVNSDGTMILPLVGPVNVDGLSVQDTAELIARTYRDKGILQAGRERVSVSVLKARVHRILVIREDTPGSPTIKTRQQTAMTKMGSATVIDLPAYENDVLHALTATGGLPGIDVHNAIWIMRSRKPDAATLEAAQMQLAASDNPEIALAAFETEYTRTLIPLRACGCESLPFNPQDIVLRDGDVVYLEPREKEVYFTGGLLPAGEYSMPRDRDIDVLEAIAIANGGVGSPASATGGVPQVLQRGAGPGNMIIPPGRCIVLRKLADGQQLRIRVDLRKALHDPKERLVLCPGDFVMMQFTPGQQIVSTFTNWFNWNMTILPTGFDNN